ncbi:MAG: zinc ribbon domain-containing protein [Planctomycetaceae bacterium]|nr:zinc ribbon domain-containing protein [Planctomycetaceae bacterium]
MPTYEYACDACDHKWEEFQSIKAPATQKCPTCGKKKARRLISAGGGFLFKGTGFYITDYRSEGYKKSASADKTSTSGGETKSESKSESKSETKSSDTKPKPESKPKSDK